MNTADAEHPRPAGSRGAATTPVDTHGGEVPRPSAAGASAGSAVDHANPRGCPFLVAETGGWRLDMPSRDHRCGAFSPPAPLSPEKQSRLCLTPAHPTCATYLASVTARTERLGVAPVRRTTRWGLARTTSVIEDPGGLRARFLAAVLDRRRWPAIPAVILITTLFVLALSGLRAGVPASQVATASPTPASSTAASTHRATPGLLATPSPFESAPPASAPIGTVPPPTTGPTSEPATPTPAASYRTYRVKSGDTLSAIANRFCTSVSAIVSLNHLSDPGALSVGQVLLIP